MAQPNSEQYGGSSTSAGDGQSVQGEGDVDVGKLAGQLHEPPSSQVGYGGGDDRYVSTPSLQKRGHWEENSNDEDSRYGQDRRGDREAPSSQVGYGGGDDVYVSTPGLQQQGHWEERDNEGDSKFAHERRGESDSGSRVEQDEGDSPDIVDPKPNPDEAGFGRSGPGGYSDGGISGGGFGDASSKLSGNYARWDAEGSEVRNGVPHRVSSDGGASGVGISNGSRSATSDDAQQQAFHLTDVSPSQQKDTPYSQVFTQPDGRTKGRVDQSHEEEGISGNTKGGTAVDHHRDREAATAQDGEEPEKEELMTKLKHKVLGHSHKKEVTDSSNVQAVDSDPVLQGDEEPGLVTTLKHKLDPNHAKGDDEPGLVTTLKHKLHANHEKHHDGLDPELWG